MTRPWHYDYWNCVITDHSSFCSKYPLKVHSPRKKILEKKILNINVSNVGLYTFVGYIFLISLFWDFTKIVIKTLLTNCSVIKHKYCLFVPIFCVFSAFNPFYLATLGVRFICCSISVLWICYWSYNGWKVAKFRYILFEPCITNAVWPNTIYCLFVPTFCGFHADYFLHLAALGFPFHLFQVSFQK